MAFQGAIRVEFGAVFPDGAYAAGKFEMVRDFDRSSGDRVVQQIDKVTGLPLWVVEVIDADEQARQRTVKVKIAATVQPVLPSPAPGSPFTAVEFEGLMATPYVDSSRCQGNGKRSMSVSPSSRKVPRDDPRSATGQRRRLDFPVPQWLRRVCVGDNSEPRRRKVKPWTAEEARQFLESAKRDQDPLYAAYVLILVMGLRKGEVVGLPWSAVNLDRGELDIGWQPQRVRRQLLHQETKTEASEASLPLSGICVAALRIREKDQAAAKAAAGASWIQGGLVFTTRAGTPVEPRNLNRRFETRCAKAGVRRITVHDMRHTCATLLAALDAHPRVAMRILRHAQIDVTMNVYTEVSDAKTLKALKRLGRQLGS